MTAPREFPVGSPFNSSRSATSKMVSSNVSRWSVGFSLVASLLGAGCAGSSAGHEDGADVEHDAQPETWNNANNPAFVDSSFVYEAAASRLRNSSIPV